MYIALLTNEILFIQSYIDPIPGGCNLAFQNKIAPYLKVHKSLSHSIFTVEYQMPSAINQLCENNTVKVDVYYYYGSDWDFSERSYFEAIKSMLKPENITENAVKVLINILLNHC